MEENFFQEIYTKFLSPWRQGAFVAYFIFIVILFGGVGIIASLFDCYHNNWADGYKIAQNFGTYFMAIIAASLVDLNLSLTIKNFASLIIYSIVAVAIAFILFYYAYNTSSGYAFIPAVIGILISWLIWILANADNDKLNDASFYSKMRGKTEGHGNNW